MEFWKLNLRIGILEIKFERNWNFENYLRIGVLENYLKMEILKIEILENYLRMGVLKIKFENWSFEN